MSNCYLQLCLIWETFSVNVTISIDVKSEVFLLQGLLHQSCPYTKSKAPVSQLVNADDTSVIEIKTQLYLDSS